jgi:AraC-like DNA-binding protein
VNTGGVPFVCSRVTSPETPGARYGAFRPRPAWTPWIARLWVQEAPPQEAPPTAVMPNGQGELIVQYGDPFVRLEGGRAVPVPAVAALGPRTRPLAVAATGRTGLVIAGLHAWASDALLGDLAGPLVDRTIDLSELVGGSRVPSLLDQVCTAAGAEARARAVEGFLGGLFRRHELDPVAVAAARAIVQRSGGVSIDALAAEMGVSDRHLRRQVARAAGLGPKRLARLGRAQRALAHLRAGAAGADVALACGYVDQAHLTRELRAFFGHTPGTLRRPWRETPLMRFFNASGPPSSSGTVYL